jgi:hypothetical protein
VDLLTFLRIAVRRWIVTVPLLALTAVVGMALVSRVDPVYKAEGSSLLLPPVVQVGDPNSTATGNPYVDSNPGLVVTASALMQSASQPDTRGQQAAAGHSPTYRIDLDEKAPILTITDTAPTPEQAVDSVMGVQDLLQRQLVAREDAAAVPPQFRITIDNLVVPEGASEETGSKLRLAAAVGILGIAAVVAGALVSESWSARRRPSRYETRRSPIPAATDAAPGSDPDTSEASAPEEVPVSITPELNGGDAPGNGDGDGVSRRRRHAYAAKRNRGD